MTEHCAMTVGNFDGVHVGHARIVAEARRVADAPLPGSGGGGRGVVVAMTFDPHPATVLRPGAAPKRLTALADKTRLLEQAGADRVVVLAPTVELLAMEPQAFVRKMVAEYAPAAVVEGPNFRFGHDRHGDVGTLAELGREHGFTVTVVAPVAVALDDQLVAPVSSSLVRWLLSCGRVSDAARCLGRHYTLAAPVVRGEQRGRTIDVPTANLDPDALADHVIPADGVYAGYAHAADGRRHPAAISIGVKPTFGRAQPAIEAHLLDFDGDLYHQPLVLHLARWLRDQQRFPTAQALQAQLARDIQRTRTWHEQGLLEPPAVGPIASREPIGQGN